MHDRIASPIARPTPAAGAGLLLRGLVGGLVGLVVS